MIFRLFSSIFVIGLGYFVDSFWSPVQMLISGKAAGMQFDTSDMSFLQNTAIQNALHYPGFITSGIVLLALFLIWIGPVKKAIVAAIGD